MSSHLYFFALFFKGICMGIADIIPGVSGGTIAFITGIYNDLLESLKSINYKNLKLLFSLRFKLAFKEIHWKFLVVLGSGIGTAFILLAHFFRFLLNHPHYNSLLYAFFLGLILASILFCFKEIKRWKSKYWILVCLGALTAFIFTWIKPEMVYQEKKYIVPLPESIYIDSTISFDNYNPELHALTDVSLGTICGMISKGVIEKNVQILDQDNLIPHQIYELVDQEPKEWGINFWQIACGTIAICAMLLPGISGSYLLTILGMYSIAINAIADFSLGLKNATFDLASFSILANLFFGIIIGLLLFSRVVSWLLNHYRDATLVTLVGFMIGALRSVWPFWKTSLELNPLKLNQGAQLLMHQPILPDLFSFYSGLALLIALIGLTLVFFLEKVVKKQN